MKILHTADWHLGHQLGGFDRTEEQTSFLEQLNNIVKEEKPDVMLICGDIYHNPNPSSSMQRLYTDYLLMMKMQCPKMNVVVIAGNHDSSSRLEIDKNLWQYADVNVIGNIERKGNELNLSKHIVRIYDAYGNILGYIVAVPYTYSQNFPEIDCSIPKEDRQEYFFHYLLDEVIEENTENKPVILCAHIAINGSIIKGHDDKRTVFSYVDAETIGEDYDYIALGHIHFPQSLNNGKIRYCGSPLPITFEEDYKHYVSIVEINNHNETPQIRHIEIKNPKPLILFPDEPKEFEDVLNELYFLPNNLNAYLKLNIIRHNVAPSRCLERILEALKGKDAKFCSIRWVIEDSDEKINRRTMNVYELLESSPSEVAKMYYKNKFNDDMPQNLIDKIDEIWHLSLKENEKSSL